MLKRTLSFALLLVTAMCAPAENTAMLDQEWVNQPVSAQGAAFHRFTMTPSPADKNLVAAYCERDPQWGGHLRVFKKAGDKIEWAAEFPAHYIEERGHYVVSYRWVKLKSTPNQVLEVLESTHMGNGSMWLLELEDRKFRVLLQATARGRYWSTDPELGLPPNGEARFVEDLKIQYQKGGIIALTGNVSLSDLSEKEIGVTAYRAEYQWDKEKRVFQDKSVRYGKPAPVKGKPKR